MKRLINFIALLLGSFVIYLIMLVKTKYKSINNNLKMILDKVNKNKIENEKHTNDSIEEIRGRMKRYERK